MEWKIGIMGNFAILSTLLPYYGYQGEWEGLMRTLSKESCTLWYHYRKEFNTLTSRYELELLNLATQHFYWVRIK